MLAILLVLLWLTLFGLLLCGFKIANTCWKTDCAWDAYLNTGR